MEATSIDMIIIRYASQKLSNDPQLIRNRELLNMLNPHRSQPNQTVSIMSTTLKSMIMTIRMPILPKANIPTGLSREHRSTVKKTDTVIKTSTIEMVKTSTLMVAQNNGNSNRSMRTMTTMICGDCTVAGEATLFFYAYMMELWAFINARMDLGSRFGVRMLLLEVISR